MLMWSLYHKTTNSFYNKAA